MEKKMKQQCRNLQIIINYKKLLLLKDTLIISISLCNIIIQQLKIQQQHNKDRNYMNKQQKRNKNSALLRKVQQCLQLTNNLSNEIDQSKKKENQKQKNKAIQIQKKVRNVELIKNYTLNFKISEDQSWILKKQLNIRLNSFNILIENLFVTEDNVTQNALASIFRNKLHYKNQYLLRKTIRYLFQITLYDLQTKRQVNQIIIAIQTNYLPLNYNEEQFLKQLNSYKSDIQEYVLLRNLQNIYYTYSQTQQIMLRWLTLQSLDHFFCYCVKFCENLNKIELLKILQINDDTIMKKQQIGGHDIKNLLMSNHYLQNCEIEVISEQL